MCRPRSCSESLGKLGLGAGCSCLSMHRTARHAGLPGVLINCCGKSVVKRRGSRVVAVATSPLRPSGGVWELGVSIEAWEWRVLLLGTWTSPKLAQGSWWRQVRAPGRAAGRTHRLVPGQFDCICTNFTSNPSPAPSMNKYFIFLFLYLIMGSLVLNICMQWC